jgi:hypothetical protein
MWRGACPSTHKANKKERRSIPKRIRGTVMPEIRLGVRLPRTISFILLGLEPHPLKQWHCRSRRCSALAGLAA